MQPTTTLDPSRPRRSVPWLRRVAGAAVRMAVRLAVAVLLAVAIVHWSGARDWPLELLHHFVPQYACAAAGLALAALLLRQRWTAAAAAALAIGFAAEYWMAPAPAADSASATGESRSLTLITNNVFVTNWNNDGLLAWLASRPADVVVLQEVNTEIAERLRRGEDGYPHRVVAEEDYIGPFGDRGLEAIAVLSRWPILEHRAPGPWAKLWQATLVRIDMPGVQPWLLVIHPPSPAFRYWLPTRDRIYAELAPVVATLDGPVIVAGDFNATPYTPVFRRFVAATGLASFTRFPATYSDKLGPIGIPIDHVLVRGAALTDLRALEPVGTDHRPLRAEILLPTDGR